MKIVDMRKYIVARRPVARQWPQNKQLGNGLYSVTIHKQQQRKGVFCVIRAEML
jgi:hypothetical protein